MLFVAPQAILPVARARDIERVKRCVSFRDDALDRHEVGISLFRQALGDT